MKKKLAIYWIPFGIDYSIQLQCEHYLKKVGTFGEKVNVVLRRIPRLECCTLRRVESGTIKILKLSS